MFSVLETRNLTNGDSRHILAQALTGRRAHGFDEMRVRPLCCIHAKVHAATKLKQDST